MSFFLSHQYHSFNFTQELELTLEPPTSLSSGVLAKTGIIIRSNEIGEWCSWY
jgi:hypothetical protein